MLLRCTTFLVVTLGVAGVAFADHNFELDANAVQDAVPGPEDWAWLYDGGLETGGSSVAYTGIVADPGNLSIFAGNEKDIQDVSEWSWKNGGGLPDKDNITNAYAAAYLDPGTGELIVYFGADRYATNGDAHMGFWFFQNQITALPNGTFDGVHSIGDILVLIHFHQGAGGGPEVHVYEWNPPAADAAPNLHLITEGLGGGCGDVPPLPYCAASNLQEEVAPWPYAPKQGTPGFLPPEAFIEGAVNLTEVLGQTICFSSFVAETRSSSSVTATLKDFVLGSFPVCSIGVEKTCDVVSLTATPGFQVDFSGWVYNNGAGSFPAGSTVTVVDDAGTPGEVLDDVTLVQVLGAPLLPGGQVPFSGSFESSENPPLNTVTATIDAFGVTTSASPFTIECTPLQLNPALQLTRSCAIELETVSGHLVVRVDVSGDVTNSGDLPLLVSVEDSEAGLLLSPILMLPGETLPYSGSYYPVAATGGETDPDLASFSSTVTATGTSSFLPAPVMQSLTASCTLCE